ncbi:MAG: PDZ domain-containing protein [Planctomycetota bacterium]|jgi:hypothetical protein
MHKTMVLTLACLIGPACLISSPAAAEDEKALNPDVVKAVRYVLAATKTKDRDKYEKELFARKDLDWPSFKEGLMAGAYYRKPIVTEMGLRHGGKHLGVRYRSADGKNRGFSLYLPKGYTAEDKSRIPVLFYLHHSSGASIESGKTKAEIAIRKFKPVCEDYNVIFVAPYTGGGAEWWTDEGVKLIDWTLTQVKARYNIDENRVGLMGALDGADAVWFVGQRLPGTFNVLMPMSGDPYKVSALIRPIYLGTLDRMDVLLGLPGKMRSRLGDRDVNSYLDGLKPLFDKRLRLTVSVQMNSHSDFHYLEKIKEQIVSFLVDGEHKRKPLAIEVDVETDGPDPLRSLWLEVQGYDADVKPPRMPKFPSTRLVWSAKKQKEPAKKLGLSMENRDNWPIGKVITRTALGANKASIAHGDVLVKVDGVEVKKGTDLAKMLKSKNWGDEVELLIAREVTEEGMKTAERQQRQYLQVREKVRELKAAGKPVPADLSDLIEEEEQEGEEEEEEEDGESVIEMGDDDDDKKDEDEAKDPTKPRARKKTSWFVFKRWVKLVRPEAVLIRQDFGAAWDRNYMKSGVRVANVVPGSLAARSGLKAGDVIEQVLGAEIKNMGDLRKAFAEFKFEKEPEGERAVTFDLKRPGGHGQMGEESITVRWNPVRPYRVDAKWDKKEKRLNVLVRHASKCKIYLTDEFVKPGEDYHVFVNGVPYQDLVDPATRPNYPHIRRGMDPSVGDDLHRMRMKRAKIVGGWKPDYKLALADALKMRDRNLVVGAVLEIDFSKVKDGFEKARTHHRKPQGKKGERLAEAVAKFGGAGE